MKNTLKAILLFSVLLISSAAFGQTRSAVFNSFYFMVNDLEVESYTHYYEKDFKQAEVSLKEILILADSLKLSEEEMSECEYYLNLIKSSTYFYLARNLSLQNRKKEALTSLEQAVEFGFSEYKLVRGDADLDNIRKDKKFIVLMDKIKQLDDLVILQNSGNYQQKDSFLLPEFIYQPAYHENLKNVKAYFNLEAIAGNGDEISKIKNLLFFVTNSVSHDGLHWGLCEYDAIDLYNYFQVTGNGLHCRLKAIMLNEIFLAMGFKSRYIICMPKSPKNPSHHTINCVYSETLKKWLWMDASFGIYIMDESGNLLSVREVREYLKSDKPLVLNPESARSKEQYLERYMAKYLYSVKCFNISRFNTESPYRGRDSDLQTITLIPADYDKDNPYMQGDVITHDPDYFWQAPE